MQRGVIQLTTQEQLLARAALGDPTNQPKLWQKLTPSQPTNTTAMEKIEVSRDDVERLLDLLPPPQPNASSAGTTLRQKLVNYLTNSLQNKHDTQQDAHDARNFS